MTTPDVTLAEFQRVIRDRYAATDRARGTPGTFMWFIEEVGELATALHRSDPARNPGPDDMSNLMEEFADVLAWLTTLANINDVDLTAAVAKYLDPNRVDGVKN